MGLPHLDRRDLGPTAVLIPLRSLREGKLRLSGTYSAAERSELIVSMATTVINAAQDLDVLVVHDDAEVEPWARGFGAMTLRPTTAGLNRAITAGRNQLREAGYGRVIVAHADLPFADDLGRADTGHDLTLIPDRHRDGTNVMCVRTNLDFTFAYGSGSFDAHCSIGRKLGVEAYVLDDPRLAWDVDHPDDLENQPVFSDPPISPSATSQHTA